MKFSIVRMLQSVLSHCQHIKLYCTVHLILQECDAVDEEMESITDHEAEEDAKMEAQETLLSERSMASYDLIHPNEVVKVLRAFVDENKQPPK